jgi:ABC-type multidrug transport system fused ATPase/permease subunit
MEDSVRDWVPIFVYIGIVAGLCEFSKAFFLGVAGEELTARLRQLVFRAMLRQDIGWFDHPRRTTGALTARLASDASEVKGVSDAVGSSLIHYRQALLCI